MLNNNIRFIIDGWVNSKGYQGGTGDESFHEDHHSNFVCFKGNIYSEPFLDEDNNYMINFQPAKYSKTLDQTKPFIYGKPSHHFHRYIKALWQYVCLNLAIINNLFYELF